MMKVSLLFGAIVPAVFCASGVMPEEPISAKTATYFKTFPMNMKQFYDDSSELTFDTTLPCGGEYEGQEEIDLFFARFVSMMDYQTLEYAVKYIDGRSGNVGVHTRMKNGEFKGWNLDPDDKKFTGDDNTVDLFHRFTFNIANGKIMQHDIQMLNSADVFKVSAPKAQQCLKQLEQAFYAEPTVGMDSEAMDLLDDEVKLHVVIDPQAALKQGKKQEWEGKEEFLNFAFDLTHPDQQKKGGDKDKKDKTGLETTDKSKEEAKDSSADDDDDDQQESNEDDDDDSKQDCSSEKNKAKFDRKVLFADSKSVYTEIDVDEYTTSNCKTVRDFSVYRHYEFDEDCKLKILKVSFSRPFSLWEIMEPPEIDKPAGEDEEDDEKKKKKNKKEDKEKGLKNGGDEDEEEKEEEEDEEVDGKKKDKTIKDTVKDAVNGEDEEKDEDKEEKEGEKEETEGDKKDEKEEKEGDKKEVKEGEEKEGEEKEEKEGEKEKGEKKDDETVTSNKEGSARRLLHRGGIRGGARAGGVAVSRTTTTVTAGGAAAGGAARRGGHRHGRRLLALSPVPL